MNAAAHPIDLVFLDDPRSVDPRLTGGKAARLAQLAARGLPVPPGFTLTTVAGSGPLSGAVLNQVRDAYATLGGVVAVRSSCVAEDLEGASFAGQYETVLNVDGESALLAAIERCRDSAHSPRVVAYLSERGLAPAPMAVLIQRMIPARAAGVAFTADPVTGERGVVVLSAVPGVGESLVSGAADGEEWEVRGVQAVRRRSVEHVLTEAEATEVAALARSLEDGGPVDIEWAYDHRTLHLLQARPMTALPEPVSWDCPHPGGFVRNFRLGEWIGAPVSPLFESWLLSGLERATHAHFEQLFGIDMPRPEHVVVNGWYFYGLNTPVMRWSTPFTMLRNAWSSWRQMAALSPPTAHLGFDSETQRWREQLLPAWQTAVRDAERTVPTAAPAALRDTVNGLVALAGLQSASIVGVAGYAAKAEFALAQFWQKHLVKATGNAFDLVAGAPVSPAAHDVEGLDWILPTLGERGPLPSPPSDAARAQVLARRDAAEAQARAHLSGRKLAAFDAAIQEARRAHVVRLEQTASFTLAWPVLRCAVLRLGEGLVADGLLDSADDVFFLTRTEVDAWIDGAGVRVPTAERRATWNRQRRLVPPLVVGELTGMFKDVFAQIDTFLHTDEHDAPDALPGMPGSPGRVTGPARVIRSVDELHRLQPGEILVAPVTTPGWTLAFGRAVAVVTDTGSVASHASIVAREHGIPAVVGTGTGTARIIDGQRITVDGSRGLVRLSGPG